MPLFYLMNKVCHKIRANTYVTNYKYKHKKAAKPQLKSRQTKAVMGKHYIYIYIRTTPKPPTTLIKTACIQTKRFLATLQPSVPEPSKRQRVSAIDDKSSSGRILHLINCRFNLTADWERLQFTRWKKKKDYYHFKELIKEI